MTKPTVGGGPKKVLYALQTATRIGLANTAKALTSKNACKACGLGMGGQRGGMVNEQDEFPAVCNKSVQAQSTDIQPGIPIEVLTHSLEDLRELDGHELEHLGRLAFPIFKAQGSDRFEQVSWEWAYDHAAKRFAATPASRTFFYSSGRSSNEAGFVLQLLARVYGANNVNNCSYYCHQATGVGLGTTIGTGTSTVELEDLDRCDLIVVIGANPASNHPRFMHKLKGCRDRGGQVIIINPAREGGAGEVRVSEKRRLDAQGRRLRRQRLCAATHRIGRGAVQRNGENRSGAWRRESHLHRRLFHRLPCVSRRYRGNPVGRDHHAHRARARHD